ncbi:uncharacterized protein LOC106078970 isoform X1 [Biomphalaria glabrata]|uniref:Uncharacterized protein LOC106078970 isoform X1 n=1 Tax=Biomphalaria glabrata TaxID=6526 RepID=A0A9W3AJP6_BIOGL|nr:uncharacterized protein LOC106078970 isoform X1 [Biomphalaria glabrata]
MNVLFSGVTIQLVREFFPPCRLVFLHLVIFHYTEHKCLIYNKENHTLPDLMFKYRSFWVEYPHYRSQKPELSILFRLSIDDCRQRLTQENLFRSREEIFNVWKVDIYRNVDFNCSGAWIHQDYMLTLEKCLSNLVGVTVGSYEANRAAVPKKLQGTPLLSRTPQTRDPRKINVALGNISYTHPRFRWLCLPLNETLKDCYLLSSGRTEVNTKFLKVEAVDQNFCTFWARLRGQSIDARSFCFRWNGVDRLIDFNSLTGSPVICSLEGPRWPQVVGLLESPFATKNSELLFLATRVATFAEWLIDILYSTNYVSILDTN